MGVLTSVEIESPIRMRPQWSQTRPQLRSPRWPTLNFIAFDHQELQGRASWRWYRNTARNQLSIPPPYLPTDDKPDEEDGKDKLPLSAIGILKHCFDGRRPR